MKKRCVVFGGGGFIGSHLTEALVNNNYKVAVFARGSNKDISNLSKVINKITFIKGDIQDISLIKKFVKRDDIIFDFISSSLPITSMQNPIDEIRRHIELHVTFVREILKIGAKKYIFASSGGGMYGKKSKFPISESSSIQPMSPHAIAKATIEFYLDYFSRIYGISYLIYRISNPYGARQARHTGFGIISTIINNIEKDVPPTLFNKGRIVRDFIYIEDLIDAILLSFDKTTKYNLYNIGSGKGTSIDRVWKMVKDLTHTKICPIYTVKRPIDVDKVILDITRFSKEFHWKPKYSLHQGLRKTLNNLKK